MRKKIVSISSTKNASLSFQQWSTTNSSSEWSEATTLSILNMAEWWLVWSSLGLSDNQFCCQIAVPTVGPCPGNSNAQLRSLSSLLLLTLLLPILLPALHLPSCLPSSCSPSSYLPSPCSQCSHAPCSPSSLLLVILPPAPHSPAPHPRAPHPPASHSPAPHLHASHPTGLTHFSLGVWAFVWDSINISVPFRDGHSGSYSQYFNIIHLHWRTALTQMHTETIFTDIYILETKIKFFNEPKGRGNFGSNQTCTSFSW